MTTIQQSELSDATIFRKLWAIGALGATLFAIPVTLWGDKFPWLIAVPVVICVGWAIYIDLTAVAPRQEESQASVVVLPQEFRGLSKYRRTLGLYVETEKLPSELQMDLFGAPEPAGKPQKRVIVLRDDHGRKFVLVECDRFMARVNSVIEDDVKRAAEHAFKMGWKRIEQIAQQNPELAHLFEDPLILDAVKADFQANVSICMAKSSHVAAEQFLDDSSKPTATLQYRISQEKAKSATKK